MKCTFEPVFNLLLCIAVSNEFGFESCLHLKEQKLKTPSSLKSPFAHSIFLLSTCNVGLKTWKNKGYCNSTDTPICNSNSNHPSTFQNFYDFGLVLKNGHFFYWTQRKVEIIEVEKCFSLRMKGILKSL